jgi:signal transduction histidine kinase
MFNTADYQQLLQQLNESKRRLDLMRIVGFELNRVSTLSAKLQHILSILHDQFYINYSMLLLPNQEGNKLAVHCSYGYEEDKTGFEVPMGTGIIGLAAQKRLPINITGLERKRKYVFTTTALPAQPSAVLPGLTEPESQIAIPMVANDALVAVLLAESYNVCVFSKEDEAFLITLSQSIAVSIQNSLLFDTMESLIAQRTEELQKSNETKNRLFSLISHDLRGPITSFHNIARLVSYYNKQNEREKIDRLSQRIDQSVNKLNTLLDNLLNWSLTQTEGIQCRPQTLSLTSLLNEVIDVLKEYMLLKEITVSTDYAPDIYVSADYNMLMAVFRNLLSNALKYTPRGKFVAIRTSLHDGKVLIEIADNGVGISADKLTTIFEPSEKKSTPGTEQEKGTGLGLLVVKEFVSLNGGTITMESQPEQGTTVQIRFPVS